MKKTLLSVAVEAWPRLWRCFVIVVVFGVAICVGFGFEDRVSAVQMQIIWL